jgi:hypothetical protein
MKQPSRPALALFLQPLFAFSLFACSAQVGSNLPAPAASSQAASSDAVTPQGMSEGVYNSNPSSFRLALSDRGAVLVYSETVADRKVFKLRRLDESGATLGSTVELGSDEGPASDQDTVTVASDGTKYVACFEVREGVRCVSVPLVEGPASPWLSSAGSAPSIAFSSGEWALATLTVAAGEKSVKTHLVNLTNEGKNKQEPLIFEHSSTEQTRKSGVVLLTPAIKGFLMVSGNDSALSAHWFYVGLGKITPPVALGKGAWRNVSMATNGLNGAVSMTHPYGYKVILFGTNGVEREYDPQCDDGDKTGIPVELAPTIAGFSITRFIDQKTLKLESLERAIASSHASAYGDTFTTAHNGINTLVAKRSQYPLPSVQNEIVVSPLAAE